VTLERSSHDESGHGVSSMDQDPTNDASEVTVRNPSIDAMDTLIGEWSVTLSDAFFLEPDEQPQYGEAVFRWVGEAFVEMTGAMRGEPTWHFVFGRSDPNEQLVALYHDPRPTSRVFDMTYADGTWTMLREDPDFHQRFVATVTGDRIEGVWEASEDQGATWRKDFDLTFERVRGG
jgi:hypothetical protein